jgi:predicted nuclease with TOPRIM domain
MMALTAEDMRKLKELVEDVFTRRLDEAITRRIDPKFEGIERRLDNVELRLGVVEQRLDKVEQRVGVMEQRLDGLSGDMRLLREDTTIVKNAVKDHGFEIARLNHRAA